MRSRPARLRERGRLGSLDGCQQLVIDGFRDEAAALLAEHEGIAERLQGLVKITLARLLALIGAVHMPHLGACLLASKLGC